MRTKLLVAFVLLSVAISGIGVGQEVQNGADLNVRQPAYIEEPVQQSSINGTPLYEVRGSPIRIAPTNFNDSAVVDFGVDTQVGSMSYDSDFDEYVFEPEQGNGTFELYWIVSEPRTVTEGNETQRRFVQVRYSALVRVQGRVDVAHIPSEQVSRNAYYRDLGEDVNETVGDLRDRNLPLALNSGSDREILNAMVVRYVNTGNPIAALTGNYTDILVLIVATLGGLLFALQYFGVFAYVVRKLRGQLNLFETIESEEGELADRQARVDEMERKQILQKVDWNDIFENDHVARAFRTVFGETPHDGYQKLVNTQILPEVWVKERLAAMGHSGWKGVPTYDDQGNLVDCDIVRPEESADGKTIDSLLDEGLVDVIDWNDENLRDFDLPNADFDPDQFDETPTTMSLGNLIRELDIQMTEFENEKQAGKYLREYVEYVKNHNYTDSDGRPQRSREMLNEWLKLSQILGDRYAFPETHYVEQAITRALLDWDPSDQARTFVREVRDGRA